MIPYIYAPKSICYGETAPGICTNDKIEEWVGPRGDRGVGHRAIETQVASVGGLGPGMS